VKTIKASSLRTGPIRYISKVDEITNGCQDPYCFPWPGIVVDEDDPIGLDAAIARERKAAGIPA